MTNKLKNILNIDGRGIIKIINKNKKICEEIISITSFLPKEYSLGARLYCIKNNLKNTPSCTCGNFLIYRSGKFTKTCGKKECISNKSKNTMLQKYGIEHNFKDTKKLKEIFLKKYGVDNPTKSKEIQNKIKQTNLKRYGVENVYQSEKIKDKIKETNLKRYGTKQYMLSNDYKIKIKGAFNTKRKNQFDQILGNNYILKNEQTIIYNCPICKKQSELNTGFAKLRYYRYNVNICTHCNPKFLRNSGKELELSSWIQSLDINVIKNFRLKNNKEIDIYIPELNLGIEYNGLYWHSEIFRDKNYHLNKLEQANSEGINLLFIWEDDWKYKQDIIKSIIKNKLSLGNKINSNECIIKEVNYNDTKEFLNNNHISSFIESSINLGLYYKDELVSLMSFINNKEEYELLRFCNKLNTDVIEGFSKIFNYFLNNYYKNKYNIVSYINSDLNEGILYEKMGFKFEKRIIEYWWVKGNVKEDLNFNLSEDEIMYKNGFLKVFNTGNLKYKYINKI